MSRSIDQVARELCLAFPDSEEFTSHGAPNFRLRGGRVFALLAINQHGNGRVALWVNAPAGAQETLVESAPDRYFVPPYVGPRGWIGIWIDDKPDGFGPNWSEVAARVREGYLKIAPRKVDPATIPTPQVATPDAPPAAGLVDPFATSPASERLELLRSLCLALPETTESSQFGSPVWRAGSKNFAGLTVRDGQLHAVFRVGHARQAMLVEDPRCSIPPYIGRHGWIALRVDRHVDRDELASLALESYRHFALKRMLAKLEDPD